MNEGPVQTSGGAPAAISSHAGRSVTTVVVRPEPALARGQYAWPDWGIGLLGGIGVAAGLCYLLVRWRHERSRD